KIVAYINRICLGGDREAAIGALPLHGVAKNRLWTGIGIVAATAAAYVIAVLLAYAPPGATSSWCAVKAYFEPSGRKGGFTVLVAQLENDVGAVGDRLAREVHDRYGLDVIRTCLQVISNIEDGSSKEGLFFRYNADVLFWGKVVEGWRAELHVGQRDVDDRDGKPIVLTSDLIPEFVAKQLQRTLFASIQQSAREMFLATNYEKHILKEEEVPPTNLANYADQVEALVEGAAWSDDPLKVLYEEADMYTAAGRLMLAAALANHDGTRVKKAIG